MIVGFIGKCNLFDLTCDDNIFAYTLSDDNIVWKNIKLLTHLNFEEKVKLFASTLNLFSNNYISKLVKIDPSITQPLEYNVANGIELNISHKKK